MDAPFHAGEVALQQRAGSFARLAQAGPRVVRDFMPDQHRDFFALLPFLLVACVDAQGQPWAEVLSGPPGFAHSPDPATLRIDALPRRADVLHGRLVAGAPLGLLGIQPHTRRRNRMNGTVTAVDERGFTVRVDQSFGNCPKYIVPREARWLGEGVQAPARTLHALDAEATALVRAADTFFIATAHPSARGAAGAEGVDVSHRGGAPGFVQVEDAATLLVPDYVGNGFFNTLGNLQLEPRCGLLFIDCASGATLRVAGRASLVWDGPLVASFAGAQRVLRIEVTQVRIGARLPLAWSPA